MEHLIAVFLILLMMAALYAGYRYHAGPAKLLRGSKRILRGELTPKKFFYVWTGVWGVGALLIVNFTDPVFDPRVYGADKTSLAEIMMYAWALVLPPTLYWAWKSPVVQKIRVKIFGIPNLGGF